MSYERAKKRESLKTLRAWYEETTGNMILVRKHPRSGVFRVEKLVGGKSETIKNCDSPTEAIQYAERQTREA